MRCRVSLAAFSLAVLVAPVFAQPPGGLPPDCQCLASYNSFPQTETDVGTVAYAGSCLVTPQGGQDTCVIAGTITLDYNPHPQFVPILSDTWYTPPFTFFTPSVGRTLFTISASRPCNGGTQHVFVQLRLPGLVGGTTPRLLYASLTYTCYGAQ